MFRIPNPLFWSSACLYTVWTASIGGSACLRSKSAPQEPPKARAAPLEKNAPQEPSYEFDAKPRRVVAIGDLHGDVSATRKVLRLANIMDDQERWIAEDTVLVQTGDVLDRGDDEPEIMQLLWSLQDQAPASGGRVELLLGNHEVMNVGGDLRYVTPGGFSDYANTPVPKSWEPKAQGLPPGYLGRKAAFAPGSKLARRFAQQNIAAIVGDTVFVHGGLSPAAARLGLERINQQTQAWLRGEAALPKVLRDPRGPIWNRAFGAFPDPSDCQALEASLRELGVSRMVVGHTVHQEGITAACNDQVWRIDVGMSAHYGGNPQALEILGSKVRVLK